MNKNRTVTYEQIKALFAESTKKLQVDIAKSTEGLRAEFRSDIAKSAEELQTEIRAVDAKLVKETAEIQASIADLQIEVKRNSVKLDENNAKLEIQNNINGRLSNKIGSIIESIVIPKIVDKFNEKGFHFDSVSTQTEFLKEESAGNLTEIDALLENGKFVIAIETKTDMKISDVNKHIKRIEELRSHPRFKGKKIYGAFTTAISREKPVNYALDKGFYVLLQPDVLGVKILDFPKGRSAKAW